MTARRCFDTSILCIRSQTQKIVTNEGGQTPTQCTRNYAPTLRVETPNRCEILGVDLEMDSEL